MAYRYFSGIHVMRELTRFQRVGPKAIMPVVFTSLLNLEDGQQESTGTNRLGQPVFGITRTPQVFLDFMAEQDKGVLIINWDAVDELFADGMLDDMFEGFRSLLLDLAADPAAWNHSLWDNSRRMIPLAQLQMRDRANATETPVSDELLHTAFVRQVAERPAQLVIVASGTKAAKEEAYALACRVERESLDHGEASNQMVGVLMDKGWSKRCIGARYSFCGGGLSSHRFGIASGPAALSHGTRRDRGCFVAITSAQWSGCAGGH